VKNAKIPSSRTCENARDLAKCVLFLFFTTLLYQMRNHNIFMVKGNTDNITGANNLLHFKKNKIKKRSFPVISGDEKGLEKRKRHNLRGQLKMAKPQRPS